VPYLPAFEFNPKDARFLGRPVDFVVFDGLDEGDLRQIVFVEVKTGGSKLTSRERLIRDAIRDGRVMWKEIRDTSTSAGARRVGPPTFRS
jgi:predicted Holliday junction resolvase-like endonuclease